MRLPRWLYRLQQHLAITRRESTAVLTLATLFLLGLALAHVQRRARPLPPDFYAETDRRFEAVHADSARTPAAERAATAPDTAAAPAGIAPTAAPESISPAGHLDLNTATARQLEALPRIGPKTARRILDYRAAHGPFRRVDDLVRVRGIGAKTLAGLKPHLYVGAAAPAARAAPE